MEPNQNNPNGNNNRLFLNFGNNDRFSPTDRAYPTTPSTFPQPVFPSQGQSQQGLTSPQQQQQQQFSNGFPQQGGGYFMNNPFPPQSQYASNVGQYQAAQQAPTAAYAPIGQAATTDATNGLVHQFSHQNLGGVARGAYGARQPSPSQRPRTACATGQQQGYNNYLASPVPSLGPQQHVSEFQSAPERTPEKYGAHTQNNQKRTSQMSASFFQDSVRRARERNQRLAAFTILAPLKLC
jgi:protein-serine/threonine kinase